MRKCSLLFWSNSYINEKNSNVYKRKNLCFDLWELLLSSSEFQGRFSFFCQLTNLNMVLWLSQRKIWCWSTTNLPLLYISGNKRAHWRILCTQLDYKVFRGIMQKASTCTVAMFCGQKSCTLHVLRPKIDSFWSFPQRSDFKSRTLWNSVLKCFTLFCTRIYTASLNSTLHQSIIRIRILLG